MKLYIVRHGQAGENIPEDPKEDEARPLTDEGRQQVEALADWMSAQDEVPGAVFSGTSERTKETAGIFAEKFFGSPKRFTVDPNLDEKKPMEMSIMARAKDDSIKAPLLVVHHDNVNRMKHLKGNYTPPPDPMATSELRVIKAKRSSMEPGPLPMLDWKEKRRVLPSDVKDGAEDVY